MAALFECRLCRYLSSPLIPPHPQRPISVRRRCSIQLKPRASEEHLETKQVDFRQHYPPLETNRFLLDLDGEERQLVLETGAIGRQANGAVLAKHGDTVIQFC